MVETQWASLLSRVSPVAVVAVSGAGARARARAGAGAGAAAGGAAEGLRENSGGRGDTEEERAIRRACERAEVLM